MRLGPLTISFFLVAPFQVSAQAPVQSPNCALQGIVIRAATGEPLEGATLTLLHLNSSDQWRKATTGPKGRFEFDNVSQGEYEIMAEHEGLLSSWYGQRFPSDLGTNLVLQSGQKVSDIVLRLFPEAAISGRVTDEECKPVAQVTVYALGYGPLNCRRQWSSAASARTDHRGFYHLSGLQSSRYLVLADYGTSVVGFYKLKHSYAPTYYPGTSDPHNAAAIEVTAGNELPGVDFSLVLAGSVFNVEGKARYGSSPPPASMAIGLAPQRSDSEFPVCSNYTVWQGEDGSFRFSGVQPGSYVLFADSFYENKQYRARASTEVRSTDVKGLKLELAPAAELSGHVLVEGRTPLDVTKLVVQASTVGGVNMWGDQSSVSPDGSFIMKNVSDGSYRLEVFGAPENFYVKAATLGGRDVLEKVFSFTSADSSNPLEILLSATAARVDGVVMSHHRPWNHGLVILAQATLRAGLCTRAWAFAVPDQYGRFRLKSIPPGDYKLFAFDRVEIGWNDDPDFFSPYQSRGVPVRLGAGSRLNLELELIRFQ